MKTPLVFAPNAISPAIEMMNGFLESRILAGGYFQPGQIIQCSWMVLKVSEDQKGKTAILGPRTGVMPIDFISDCSDALNLVLTQRYICDSFGVDCCPCSARQSALVVKDIADCKEVFIDRTEAENENSSGWFFGASDSKLDVNHAANLELKSLWELACLFPNSRDFFLLPPGWQVVFEMQPTVLKDFEPAIAKADSYYARKHQSLSGNRK